MGKIVQPFAPGTKVAPGGAAWDPTTKPSTVTLSNSNFTASIASLGPSDACVRGVTTHSTGIHYAEFLANTVPGTPSLTAIGIIDTGSFVGTHRLGASGVDSIGFFSNGLIVANSTTLAIITGWDDGDYVRMFVDLGAERVWFSRIGNVWNDDPTANPEAGTGGLSFSALGTRNFALGASSPDTGDVGGPGVITLNGGNALFQVPPPSRSMPWG